MSRQVTLWDMNDATSSEGSEGGSTHCGSLDGLKTSQSGQEAVRASRSRWQGKGKPKATKDTSGQKCSGSFESADLTQYLANRCRQRLDMAGSMEYSQTWKQKATPAGRLYWEHTASARRTFDSDCSGWATPQSHDSKNVTSQSHQYQSLVKMSQTCGFELSFPANAMKTEIVPTAESTTQNADALDRHKTDMSTPSEMESCTLAGWGTPLSNHANGTPEDFLRRKRESVERGNSMGVTLSDLNMQVQAWTPVGWASPSSRDWKDSPGMATEATNPNGSLRKRVVQLPRQAQLASGQTSESFLAQTAKRGVLDAAFSRWLMGFPETWDEASPNWESWQEVQEVIASGVSRAMETP